MEEVKRKFLNLSFQVNEPGIIRGKVFAKDQLFRGQKIDINDSEELIFSFVLSFAVRPVHAAIVGGREPVSAEKPLKIECRSSGSRPAAVITWYKNNKFMGPALESKVSRALIRVMK